jgi:PKD repeat protein
MFSMNRTKGEGGIMSRKQKALLAISLVLSIMMFCPNCGTLAAGVSEHDTAPPEPHAIQSDDLKSLQLPAVFSSSSVQSGYPCKRVLFLDDRGAMYDSSAAGYSFLRETLVSLGFAVDEIFPAEITASLISGYDIVVFSMGWFGGGVGQRVLSDSEASALVQFANSGNSLFLIGDLGLAYWSPVWQDSLNKVAAGFGITFNPDMLCSSASHFYYSGDPDGGVDMPYITDISSGLLADGVQQFLVVWGSSITASLPAQSVARSDITAWQDTDCTWNYLLGLWECRQDPSQTSGVKSVIAQVQAQGRILAIGDSSWMLNGWIMEAGNLKLAANAFAWLGRIPSVMSLSTGLTKGIAPETISFTCNLKDPGTRTTQFLWDFTGDGSIDASTTTNQTSYTYATPGTYSATCTVVDAGGCSATSQPVSIVIVRNQPPVIDSFTAVPTTGTLPLTVQFNCSAQDPDGLVVNYCDAQNSANSITGYGTTYTISINNCMYVGPDKSITNYVLNFGDGSSISAGSATHRYSSAGNYSATCTALDSKGGSTTSNPISIRVNSPPVINSFSRAPATGTAPLQVTFTCNATDADGSISSYQWNFGDGSSTSTPNGSVNHLYSTGGNFNATCTAVDNDGASVISNPVSIRVNFPPVINLFSAVPTPEGPNGEFDFTCSATDPDGSITNYVLNYGDGNSDSTTNGSMRHLYNTGGDYSATCTAFDNEGGSATSNPLSIYVNSLPVINNFLAAPTDGFAPLQVTFRCSATDLDGTITSYIWNFGDGNSTSTATGSKVHLYTAIGTHSATCTAVDNDGGATTSNPISITVNVIP